MRGRERAREKKQEKKIFNPPPFHSHSQAALGVAIIVYGFMRGLGGILVVAIGVWALFSTAEIVAAAVRGDAASHPLFCFENGQQHAQAQQQAPVWPPQAAPPPGANPFAASRV